MKLEILILRDRFDIIVEIRLSGVAEQEYTMSYGKSYEPERVKAYFSFFNVAKKSDSRYNPCSAEWD